MTSRCEGLKWPQDHEEEAPQSPKQTPYLGAVALVVGFHLAQNSILVQKLHFCLENLFFVGPKTSQQKWTSFGGKILTCLNKHAMQTFRLKNGRTKKILIVHNLKKLFC